MSARPLKELSQEELQTFFDSFDWIVTDCDGVLWLLNNVIEGCPAAMKLFREMGKKVFYVTNNSTKTRMQYVQKCQKLGYEAKEDEVICAAYLVALCLKEKDFKGKVYIIGHDSIASELDALGIAHTEVGPDPMIAEGFEVLANTFTRDPEIKGVIVGFDEHISYTKLMKAASYLSQPDCVFIGTNTDESFPLKPDITIPGTGAFVRSVETCSQRSAYVVGKPSTFLGEILIKHHNIDPKRTLMIGDRGNTDILLGTRCGFQTLLVLTGVTKLNEVEEWKKSSNEKERSCLPDYYIDCLANIVDIYKSPKRKTCKKAP